MAETISRYGIYRSLRFNESERAALKAIRDPLAEAAYDSLGLKDPYKIFLRTGALATYFFSHANLEEVVKLAASRSLSVRAAQDLIYDSMPSSKNLPVTAKLAKAEVVSEPADPLGHYYIGLRVRSSVLAQELAAGYMSTRTILERRGVFQQPWQRSASYVQFAKFQEADLGPTSESERVAVIGQLAIRTTELFREHHLTEFNFIGMTTPDKRIPYPA